MRRLLGPLYPAYVLAKIGIDILHVHHIPLFKEIRPAARLSKIPAIVYTEHARYSISRSEKLQSDCRHAIGQADCFTTVSEDLKRFFIDEVGIAADAATVVHSGVDIEKFKPDKDRKHLAEILGMGDSKNFILSVGRLTEAKDHTTFLEAIALLKDWGLKPRAAIVGDGELRSMIEGEIARRGLGGNVHMLGSRTDVDRLLSGARVFVQHSQREGFPVSILEAMATGLPVVSTRVGAVSEVIRDGCNGFLVPPKNPNELANAIAMILKNESIGNNLGRQARKTIEIEFSLEKTVEKFSEIYFDIYRRKTECARSEK